MDCANNGFHSSFKKHAFQFSSEKITNKLVDATLKGNVCGMNEELSATYADPIRTTITLLESTVYNI